MVLLATRLLGVSVAGVTLAAVASFSPLRRRLQRDYQQRVAFFFPRPANTTTPAA
jgi:steroid 5-alpha reductase family enzyme